ncbi:gliding motility-associated C-terminal domain-containing protein [Spirosoma montaniterrae]|uniref:Gliding motility-associated C-terminal domain-containing protein n=1 Tax=Spirosoma montaniterrae TaxID=1178516 RepID=A0A1P9WZG7_9BACT|nr:gliding motility-associated C-terminal domain-containing protein [Spirosoma montaniterrae]AQG80776.1 hypothetical protein AWR27_16485 [Spirosoma montaniterrae]
MDSFTGRAQTCTNQTGNLLLNETFGQGNNRPSLVGKMTYAYTDDPCPVDGKYTVTNRVDGNCFLTAWHSIGQDHTGNANGNLLIINASAEPGVFYQQSADGLCGGASYEFSVWGINLLEPGSCTTTLPPYLAVSVESASGRVLEQVDLGIIPETTQPTWTRYAAVFTVPDTDERVIIKLINKQGEAGCGNDMALDDLQLRQCTSCTPLSVFAPDAFTPNNDGLNDEFVVRLRGVYSYNLNIYDRWGSVVFSSNTLSDRWNGTYNGALCLPGAYSWVVSYQFAGSSEVSEQYVQKGRVLLLR